MDSYWSVFLVMGLIMSSILVGGVKGGNGNWSYFTSASDKYCTGYTDYVDPVTHLANNTCYQESGPDVMSMFVNGMIDYITTWNGALAVIGLVAVVGISLATGALNLLVVVPFALAFILMDFLVLPIKFIQESGFPEPIPLFLQIFFYALIVLTMMSFVRSGN